MSGPSSVNEGGTGTYTATGTWDNGTTAAISPTWSENSSYATISSGGVLTASAVTSNQTVTVTASYGGLTGTRSVTIVDVPGPAPAAPKNIGITGPIVSVPTELWRLNWDPVTTYADDAPLDPGRTVRYTVYWTDDPALTAGSLRLLASSVPANMVDFDPLGYPMVRNQLIYLTARSDPRHGRPVVSCGEHRMGRGERRSRAAVGRNHHQEVEEGNDTKRLIPVLENNPTRA